MASRRPLAYLVMLTAGVMWGATFSLQKIVMNSPVADPIGVSLWYAVMGSLIGLSLAALQGHLPRFDRVHLRFYVLLGLLGTALPNLLFFTVAPHLPAGVLALSVTTVPLMTYGAAMALRVEAFDALRGLGLLFGFAAMALVLVPEASLPERGQALWLLPALLAALCFAGEAMLATFQRPAGSNALVLIAGSQAAAAIMVAPIVLVTGRNYPIAWPLDRSEIALFLMAALSTPAYALYLYMVRTAGAVFASQVGYLVTLAGVGWGMLLFGERHSLWIWGAIVLLMIGVTLVRPRAD